MSISEFVNTIKESSADHWNNCQATSDRTFDWEESYAVFTLDSEELDKIKAYVDNQKRHHAKGTIILDLELQ